MLSRLSVSNPLSYTIFALKSPRSSVLICHWDAWWVSPASVSLEADADSVGVNSTNTSAASVLVVKVTVSPSAGPRLAGWPGALDVMVVNNVWSDQLDHWLKLS